MTSRLIFIQNNKIFLFRSRNEKNDERNNVVKVVLFQFERKREKKQRKIIMQLTNFICQSIWFFHFIWFLCIFLSSLAGRFCTLFSGIETNFDYSFCFKLMLLMLSNCWIFFFNEWQNADMWLTDVQHFIWWMYVTYKDNEHNFCLHISIYLYSNLFFFFFFLFSSFQIESEEEKCETISISTKLNNETRGKK